MSKQIQLRRGTTTQVNTAPVGAEGEVWVDTTKNVIVVNDGVTVGGSPVAARANADGTISLIKKDGTSAGVINSTGLFNNTLTSTNTDQAVTAAQAKVLQDSKLNISSAFGVGQTWQDVTIQRVVNTTYSNVSGRTIFISVGSSGTNALVSVVVDGSVNFTQNTGNNLAVTNHLCIPIPHGSTYKPTSDFTSFLEFK